MRVNGFIGPDREKVKTTARDLPNTLKAGILVLDLRKCQQSQAEVRVTIEKMLNLGLPRVYTPALKIFSQIVVWLLLFLSVCPGVP